MFKLVIQDDEGKTTVVPLIRDEITIGRKEGNTIRLTERNVSRRHARILRQNGEVQIEDLGSYNGIRVNNARIAERVALRVSDQVQIGDYKLYLKAEGVEQVDDARTVPIERIDMATATDVMPITPSSSPTMPLGVPQTPHPDDAVTNPHLAAMPGVDADPAGRPVATAAAVAALTASADYGRLVVLSSNFAGKQFELSRPQMIIGRTDENDLVINHRSISRNHAKLVREPETGRYTISDLQSSNGVRVNGQDYGKVELRRGDVVDLGHVRLRFVEPGEDFVFSRDAVITDVPDTGGKKGLLAAVLLAVIVVGGIGAFLMSSKGGTGEAKVGDQGRGAARQVDVAAGGSADVVTNGSAAVAAPDPVPAADAGAAVAVANPGDEINMECLTLAADRKWRALTECAERLAAVDGAKATEYRAKAIAEDKAMAAVARLEAALARNNFKGAKLELGKIPDDSVYRNDAQTRFEAATADAAAEYERRAKAAAEKDCRALQRIQREANQKGIGERAALVRCQVEVAVKPPDGVGANPGNGSGATNPGVGSAKPACDAAALKQKGDDYLRTGMDAAALASFESAMRCKPDTNLLKLAYMAACRSKNADKAKAYYARLPASQATTQLSQICITRGIQIP